MFGLQGPGGARIKGASFWIEVKVATGGAGAVQPLPPLKDVGLLASLLFSNADVVEVLQKEFPAIVEAIKSGDSLASVVRKLMEKHKVLADQPFLRVVEPYFSVVEDHLRRQATSMWALLRSQSKVLMKAQKQAERKEEAKKKAQQQRQHKKAESKKKNKKNFNEANSNSNNFNNNKSHHAGGGAAGSPVLLRSKFVSDVTILDNSKLVGGSKVVKIWKLKNVGQTAWPSGTLLVKLPSSNFDCADSIPLSDKDLPAPGCEVSVRLPITVPTKPGKHVATFRLSTRRSGVEAKSHFFGQKIWVSFIVEGVPLKAKLEPVVKEGPPKAVQKESELDNKLAKLAHMGFKDRELNVYLVGVYGGNMKKVVAWLLNNC